MLGLWWLMVTRWLCGYASKLRLVVEDAVARWCLEAKTRQWSLLTKIDVFVSSIKK